VVWEPILATDWNSPRTGTLARIWDPRAIQFWDNQHLVAQSLRKSMKATAGYSEPRCCIHKGFFWDMAFVFAAQSRWPEALPLPRLYSGPVVSVAEKLNAAIGEDVARSELH
jgi:hypothetical protein